MTAQRPTTQGNTLTPRAHALANALIQRLTELEQTNWADASRVQQLHNRCFTLGCSLEDELFGGPDNLLTN